jgi:hypothetical protein
MKMSKYSLTNNEPFERSPEEKPRLIIKATSSVRVIVRGQRNGIAAGTGEIAVTTPGICIDFRAAQNNVWDSETMTDVDGNYITGADLEYVKQAFEQRIKKGETFVFITAKLGKELTEGYKPTSTVNIKSGAKGTTLDVPEMKSPENVFDRGE